MQPLGVVSQDRPSERAPVISRRWAIAIVTLNVITLLAVLVLTGYVLTFGRGVDQATFDNDLGRLEAEIEATRYDVGDMANELSQATGEVDELTQPGGHLSSLEQELTAVQEDLATIQGAIGRVCTAVPNC